MSNSFLIHYHHNVVAAYAEYVSVIKNERFGRSKDLRKAIDAASALFHLREHLPPNCCLSRARAESLCSDYGLLGDVVNSHKHNVIHNSTPHGAPMVNSAGSISEQQMHVSYTDANGEYWATIKAVFFNLVNGGDRLGIEVLTNVINFWEDYLHEKGILQNKRAFSFDSPFRHRTRQECGMLSPDLEITVGLPAQIRFRMLKYDAIQGRAVPIDLTGANIEFKVFKPKPVDIDICLKRNADGKVFMETVRLSLDETMALGKLKSAAATDEFLKTLPAINFALRKLTIKIKEEATM